MTFLPVVLTCDDHYFKYANVVITSIIENSVSSVQYEINILSEFISEENQKIAQKQIEKYKNFKLIFRNLENFDGSKFHLNSYMSASTYYRFYIPEIFKDYERILYLDSDLIVDYDISALAVKDFEDKLALCCPSPYIHNIIKNGGTEEFPMEYFTEVLKMKNPLEYFNAGVMVYNLKKINQLNLGEKFFESVNEIKEPKLQDQDLLNSVMAQNGGVKLISQKYNNTRSYKITQNRLKLNRLKKFLRMKDSNRLFYIYHYVGKDKPWKSKRVDDALFYYYAKKSPFYQQILEENQHS